MGMIKTSANSRLALNLLLASGLALGAVQTAQAAQTRAECVAKARSDYDSAVNACWQWASDPDPYNSCMNDAAFAHQTAYQKCQKIVNRGPSSTTTELQARRTQR